MSESALSTRKLLASKVAISTNLVTWQTGTNVVQEISATPDANPLTETVKAQFVTVRVWLLSTGP